jgi:hypothetical protein
MPFNQNGQHFYGAPLSGAHFLGAWHKFNLKCQQLPAVFSAVFNAKYAFLNFGANP